MCAATMRCSLPTSTRTAWCATRPLLRAHVTRAARVAVARAPATPRLTPRTPLGRAQVAVEAEPEEQFRLAQFDALNSFGARRSEVWINLEEHPWK